jgi:hypothetical protein
MPSPSTSSRTSTRGKPARGRSKPQRPANATKAAPETARGASAPARTAARKPVGPKYIVKTSRIHGRGVYAKRKIAKGERIIEYKGERISWREADRRPPSDPKDPNHTFFFALDDGKRVIDAKVRGNAARWINHSCDPNCETEEEEGRVFIQALRDIRRGEELFYDYGLITDERITPTLKLDYRCLCGAKDCRGTMLALRKRKKK